MLRFALAILLVWLMAGAIPLFTSGKTQRGAFAGLAVFSVGLLAYLLA